MIDHPGCVPETWPTDSSGRITRTRLGSSRKPVQCIKIIHVEGELPHHQIFELDEPDESGLCLDRSSHELLMVVRSKERDWQDCSVHALSHERTFSSQKSWRGRGGVSLRPSSFCFLLLKPASDLVAFALSC
jgi:hypothetical protein